MSKIPMFAIRTAEGGEDLGEVRSSNPALLRAFGAAYMRDPKAKGEVALFGPNGQLVATYDIWQDRWEDAEAKAG